MAKEAAISTRDVDATGWAAPIWQVASSHPIANSGIAAGCPVISKSSEHY
jgi:hypothetical protein